MNEAEPNDISYVFSGYAPLSVRIVQCALQKNFLNNLGTSTSLPQRSRTPAAAVDRGTSPASTNISKASSRSTPADGGGTAISSAQNPGFKPFEDILSRIKGATVDIVQRGTDPEASRARSTLRGTTGAGSGQQMTSIVFFLGGITYAEIAALRFVAKQLGEKRRLLICTTGIISGNKVVDAVIEKKGFGAS